MADMTARALSNRSAKTSGAGYNLAPGLFRFKAAIGEAPTRNVVLNCIGDSITQGYRAGDFDTYSWPARLRSLLQAQYGGNEHGFQTSIDPAIIKTGTWTRTFNFGTAIGTQYSSTAGATMTFTFTGTSVDVIYTRGGNSTTYGTASVTIDAVNVGTIDCTTGAGTTIGNKITFSGLTSGSHTLVLTTADTKRVYIEGFIPHTGSTNGIVVNRMGFNGSDTTSNYWNNVGALQPSIDNFQPDLTFIALSTNNSWNSLSLSGYKSDMGVIISRALQYGSVCLIPMMWGDLVQVPTFSTIPQFVQAMYELADQYNVALIDIFKAFGNTPTQNNYANGQSYGMFGVPNTGTGEAGTDMVHPSNKGMQFIASTIYQNLQK
jgi:lysophospholipase L1-like esterase